MLQDAFTEISGSVTYWRVCASRSRDNIIDVDSHILVLVGCAAGSLIIGHGLTNLQKIVRILDKMWTPLCRHGPVREMPPISCGQSGSLNQRLHKKENVHALLMRLQCPIRLAKQPLMKLLTHVLLFPLRSHPTELSFLRPNSLVCTRYLAGTCHKHNTFVGASFQGHPVLYLKPLSSWPWRILFCPQICLSENSQTVMLFAGIYLESLRELEKSVLSI